MDTNDEKKKAEKELLKELVQLQCDLKRLQFESERMRGALEAVKPEIVAVRGYLDSNLTRLQRVEADLKEKPDVRDVPSIFAESVRKNFSIVKWILSVVSGLALFCLFMFDRGTNELKQEFKASEIYRQQSELTSAAREATHATKETELQSKLDSLKLDFGKQLDRLEDILNSKISARERVIDGQAPSTNPAKP